MLPMGFGYIEGVTHGYKRHGTTTLFAALNVLNGAVLATCKPRHRHQQSLSFLREIDKAVPIENWTFIASSTTTPRTITPRSRLGWQVGRDGTCISSRPTALGSIKSNDSSR
jgi:hypothetical protein